MMWQVVSKNEHAAKCHAKDLTFGERMDGEVRPGVHVVTAGRCGHGIGIRLDFQLDGIQHRNDLQPHLWIPCRAVQKVSLVLTSDSLAEFHPATRKLTITRAPYERLSGFAKAMLGYLSHHHLVFCISPLVYLGEDLAFYNVINWVVEEFKVISQGGLYCFAFPQAFCGTLSPVRFWVS